jgi:hypothetical protein
VDRVRWQRTPSLSGSLRADEQMKATLPRVMRIVILLHLLLDGKVTLKDVRTAAAKI